MSDSRIRVAVVYGGTSSEHSISCVSAGSILRALDPARFEVVRIGVDRQGTWRLDDQSVDLLRLGTELPEVLEGSVVAFSVDRAGRGFLADGRLIPVDVAFPVLHGPFGEDGTVQGLFEVMGLPYVGSGVLASALGMDKGRFKVHMRARGIDVGDFVTFHRDEWDADPTRVRALADTLGWPVFVKPARAGSSQGISKVSCGKGLDAAVDAALRHDPRIIVEAGLSGVREIEIGVLGGRGGPRVSVCGEIRVRTGHDFYDFEAKYLDGSVDLIVDADLPPGVRENVAATACEAFLASGCEGLARVDFFVGEHGRVVLNEVNTMPGFTSASMFPQLWAATGVGYTDLVTDLVLDALRRGVGLR